MVSVWSWLNFSPCIDIVLIFFFHILVIQEYWVQRNSRMLFKPVLRGIRIVALSLSSHDQRLNKIDSTVLLYCRSSIFLKDPFFPYYLGYTRFDHIYNTKDKTFDWKNILWKTQQTAVNKTCTAMSTLQHLFILVPCIITCFAKQASLCFNNSKN